MKPKRIKRRAKRELQFGPERKVISFNKDQAVLECNHIVILPTVEKMFLSKLIRCKDCIPSDNG